VFRDDVIKLEKGLYPEEYVPCPLMSCRGENVVQVDEMILPVIRTLNMKGYRTEYSCSDHAYESLIGTYICFEEIHDFKDLPKGYKLEIHNDKTIIRDCYDSLNKSTTPWNDGIKRQAAIMNSIKGLMQWADNLEKLEE